MRTFELGKETTRGDDMTSTAEPMKKHRTTQKEDVLNFMRRFGSIQRMQSFQCLGVCELASRIGEIEADGVKIKRDRVHGRAENGRPWTITRYSIQNGDTK